MSKKRDHTHKIQEERETMREGEKIKMENASREAKQKARRRRLLLDLSWHADSLSPVSYVGGL